VIELQNRVGNPKQIGSCILRRSVLIFKKFIVHNKKNYGKKKKKSSLFFSFRASGKTRQDSLISVKKEKTNKIPKILGAVQKIK
jgi:hypothetical protein